MEEILASIRKIISEDTGDNQPPKQDTEVLDLTQEVQDEPAPVAAAPVLSVVASNAPEALASSSQPEATLAPVAAPPDAGEASAENASGFVSNEESSMSAPLEQPGDNGIFSEKSRQAIDDAFAGLDTADEPAPHQAAAPSMPVVNGNSVEAVFERAVTASVQPLLHQWMDGRKDDLLAAVKPMIREWMDEHFPALLEGAVREEVARVVKARGRR